MGRAPCCEKVGLKKGRWTAEEDQQLIAYIKAAGEGSWRSLPKNAGLLRCGKSCRLRWINYLRDDLKRGNITTEEEETIMKLHSSIGNKWSLIASHLPGRTDNEIKNYWNSHLCRKINKNTNTEIVDGETADEEKSKPAKKSAKNNDGKLKSKKKSSKKKKQEKAIIESPTDSSISSSAQSEGEAESMVLDPDPHQTSSISSSITDLEAEPQALHVVETGPWSANDELELDYDDLFGDRKDTGTFSAIEKKGSGSYTNATLSEERETGILMSSSEERESGSLTVIEDGECGGNISSSEEREINGQEREGGLCTNTTIIEEREFGASSVSKARECGGDTSEEREAKEQERETDGDQNPNFSGTMDVKEAGGGGGNTIVRLMEEEALSKEMEGPPLELDMEGIDDVWTWLCDGTEDFELGIQGNGDCTIDYQNQVDSIASWLLSDSF